MQPWKNCSLVLCIGEFALPGLLKVNLRKVPARRAGTLVRDPSTGEMVKAAAKPAGVRVKIRIVEAKDRDDYLVRNQCGSKSELCR
jgi:hypothetical protein